MNPLRRYSLNQCRAQIHGLRMMGARTVAGLARVQAAEATASATSPITACPLMPPPLPTNPPELGPRRLTVQPVSPILSRLRRALWEFNRTEVWDIYQHLASNSQLSQLSLNDHRHVLHSITLKSYLWQTDDTVRQELRKFLYVWHRFRECGHRPGLREYNHLLEILARSKDIEQLQAAFNELQATPDLAPSFFSWSMLMYGYAKAGDSANTLATFEVLRTKFHHRSGLPRTILIELCGVMGQVDEAIKIYEQVGINTLPGDRAHFVRNTYTTNALLRVLGAHGRLPEMRNLFSAAWQRQGTNGLDFRSFQIMIRWHAKHNMLDGAQRYFELMQAPPFGFVPNAETFRFLVPPAACTTDPEFAHRYVSEMANRYNLQPLDYMLKYLVEMYEGKDSQLMGESMAREP
ncbi:hypothetical protein IWQ60_000131 [Tieghemiomyces parasiticus]|uniref:Pentatricopeptide repeat-containing protein n=1 Tax=Tieghemiomyces parasiticus TaxID=78921 RepID=A0A9W8AFC7_9FUNG|nr:hypothetical protein IWQ60_000131 [Tieghemiomyces parasiticus]